MDARRGLASLGGYLGERSSIARQISLYGKGAPAADSGPGSPGSPETGAQSAEPRRSQGGAKVRGGLGRCNHRRRDSRCTSGVGPLGLGLGLGLNMSTRRAAGPGPWSVSGHRDLCRLQARSDGTTLETAAAAECRRAPLSPLSTSLAMTDRLVVSAYNYHAACDEGATARLQPASMIPRAAAVNLH